MMIRDWSGLFFRVPFKEAYGDHYESVLFRRRRGEMRRCRVHLPSSIQWLSLPMYVIVETASWTVQSIICVQSWFPSTSRILDQMYNYSFLLRDIREVATVSISITGWFSIFASLSSGPKEFVHGGKNYFFTGHILELKDKKFDWLDGRNLCREFCMDLVTLDTQEKNNLIFRLIQKSELHSRYYNVTSILWGLYLTIATNSFALVTDDVPYIWTSGRLCDFKGCEGRSDLEPKNLNGWFWSAQRSKLYPTNRVPPGWTYNPWSQSGHKKVPQPDNAEFDINQTTESCLAVLNNVYNDGIAWHDIACYHEKPVVCEDNEELLNYVASQNPGIRL